jgi:LCP family protein required for cell wall assembly
MFHVNCSRLYLFRQFSLLLCFSLLLPILLSCGALNRVETPISTQTATASFTPAATVTQTPTPTTIPTPTEIPALCGGPRVIFILLVGSDARQDSYAIGLADSMRLIRIDFVEPSIRVLAFPRDLYVEIPEIEDHNGITHGKLNQAFLYGNPGYDYYDGEGQGPGLLALTLEHNFGAQVDHYVAVNLQTFVRIIDTLGGIDIQLPYEIDGRVRGSRDPNRYFAAGKQHLNGYRTMLLARLRPGGDLQRVELQNLVMQSLAERLLSPTAVFKFPQLIASFKDSIQTDLGAQEISRLLCLRKKLDREEIDFLSFPESLFKSERVHDPVLGNTAILDADFKVLMEFVEKFSNGSWREPQEHIREDITP